VTGAASFITLRFVWIANFILLLFAAFMLVEAFVVPGEMSGWPLFWRIVWIVWPVPQAVALVISRKRKKDGREASSLLIAAASLAFFGFGTVAYLGWVLH
jgi:hypothetical protein